MHKFEVGDRVRLVKDGWYCSYNANGRASSVPEGYIGIVTSAADSDGDLTLDDDISVNKSCLELHSTAVDSYYRLSVDNQALADNYMADLLEKQNWVPPTTKHIMVTLEIDTTNLDGEAVEKVRKFAESLRRQAPPTANNKYIWITKTTDETFEDTLGIRCSDDDYAYLPEGAGETSYVHCDSIIAWGPADVK